MHQRPTVTLLHPEGLSNAAQYSYAASVAPGARMIFLAGACPLNVDGTTAEVGNVASQARMALDNMRVALEAAGAGIQDVVFTRVLVASSDRADLHGAWEVVREAFGDHDVPSTLLGVTVLGYADQLVEIEAVAAVAP